MPRVRDDAHGLAWVVTHRGRVGVAVRRDPDGATHELRRSKRLLGIDRVGLASAVLEDALAEQPPSHRLAADLSLFLVPAGAREERTMTALELQSWLDTWLPPFQKLFPTDAIERFRRG